MKKTAPLLQVENLTKHFPIQKSLFDKLVFRDGRFRMISQTVYALNGVDLAIQRGETLALVGESGCGKSTLAKTITGLHEPTRGRILYGGKEIGVLKSRDRRPFQRKIQIVFQDPFSSLNPRKKVLSIIKKPMDIHENVPKKDRPARVLDLLEKVGMDPAYAQRYPHQFSGGQRQRIGIARALACDRNWSLRTNPFPPWMSPFRPRSSICSWISRKNST